MADRVELTEGQTAPGAMAAEVVDVYENQRFYGVWKAPARVERPLWSDPEGYAVALPEHQLPPVAHGCWEAVITPGTDAQGWQYGTMFSHLQSKRPGGRSSRRLEDLVRRRLWRRRQPLLPLPPAQPATAVPEGSISVPLEQEVLVPTHDLANSLAASNAAALEKEDATTARGRLEAGHGTLPRGSLAAAADQPDLEAPAGAGSAGAQPEPPPACHAGQKRAASESPEPPDRPDAYAQAMAVIGGMRRSLLRRRKPWHILPWGLPAIGELRRSHQEMYRRLQEAAKARQLFDPGSPVSPRSPLHPTGGQTLQQDLLAAALHARAAYGYAAATGLMSSVKGYIRLRTVERLRFDPVGGVSAEANNDAVAEMTGVDVKDIIGSQWRSAPLQPCFYVAIDRSHQCVVLSIRGSLEHADWVSDLCAQPARTTLGGQQGWVHAGIYKAACGVAKAARGALEEAGRRVPGWPLLVTGHSLGGGVAGLVTLLLVQEGLPQGLSLMHCITLGSAAVLSANLAEAAEDLVTSVVIGCDVVPQLSYASVEATMMEISKTSPGRRSVEALNQRMSQALGMAPHEALKAEDFESWRAAAQAGARVALRAADAGLTGLLTGLLNWAGAQPPEPPQHSATDQQQQEEQSSAVPVLARRSWEQQAGLAGARAPSPAPASSTEAAAPTRDATVSPDAPSPPCAAAPSDADCLAAVAAAVEARESAGEAPSELSDEELALLTELAVTDVAELAAQQPQQAQHASAGGGAAGRAGALMCEAPELLYPPGRIIWVFPPDEPSHSLTSEAAAAAAGAAQGVAAAAAGAALEGATTAVASTAGFAMAVANQDTTNGGALTHTGQQSGAAMPGLVPLQAGTAAGACVHTSQQADAQSNVQERQAAGGSNEQTRPAKRGGGGRSQPAGSGAAGTCPPRRPVATLAERHSFERILILPDILSDHLPDTYIQTIKQL